jgi:hypothetical protein
LVAAEVDWLVRPLFAYCWIIQRFRLQSGGEIPPRLTRKDVEIIPGCGNAFKNLVLEEGWAIIAMSGKRDILKFVDSP